MQTFTKETILIFCVEWPDLMSIPFLAITQMQVLRRPLYSDLKLTFICSCVVIKSLHVYDHTVTKCQIIENPGTTDEPY